MTEQKRYKAVAEQIAHLLDQAAQEMNPLGALLHTWLAAEMYIKNERIHEREEGKDEEACQTT